MNPSQNKQILNASKLKELAADNFNFDEMGLINERDQTPVWNLDSNFVFPKNETGRQFSKRVLSTAGKEEIACSQQFLLFPQCFHKTCIADS